LASGSFSASSLSSSSDFVPFSWGPRLADTFKVLELLCVVDEVFTLLLALSFSLSLELELDEDEPDSLEIKKKKPMYQYLVEIYS
jgi:hypothetical protein